MAIDAFRKQEQARRRLTKAEAEANKAARRIPSEEFHLWALATEIVRFESFQRDAIENGPPEDVDIIASSLVTMRAQLQSLQADLKMRQDMAETEDRPVPFTGDPHKIA
jgi:hypothetical protein